MAESVETMETTPEAGWATRSVQRRVTFLVVMIALFSFVIGMLLGSPTITPVRAAMGAVSWLVVVGCVIHAIRRAIKPL